MSLSPEDVEDIVKVLDSTDYDELELSTDRFVLRLRRGPGGWTEELSGRGSPHLLGETAGSAGSAGAAEVAGAGGAERASGREGKGDGDGDEAAGDDPAGPGDEGHREGLVAVRAPLPGVFYRAPKPGEPPFVEVGDQVEADTVVAILETMKLMNPVRAGAAGRVVELPVANSEPAQQGAVLAWLAPLVPGGAGTTG